MWRLYDSERIDRELGYIKSVGANNVRDWQAWVVFDVDKFKDFLALACRNGLSVMPVLWDSCFGDASATYEDLDDWGWPIRATSGLRAPLFVLSATNTCGRQSRLYREIRPWLCGTS
ncbi:MAG: hypothetical protein OXC19_01575 [Bryobacterales bacterium]|nr:hypothetical protein [Bryobacterales bacterium]